MELAASSVAARRGRQEQPETRDASMVSLLLIIWNFIRGMVSGTSDPAFRRILSTAVIVLISGTIAMNRIEGWSLFDSFYFSVIALTTVGFGDFSPQTDLGKLFTIFYVLTGIGIIVAFVNALGERRLARSRRRRKEASE
jgi:voltage-gated potassium channel